MITKRIIYLTVLFAGVLIIVFWSSGLFRLWSVGIASLANNTKEFTNKSGHLIEGKYSLSVDLSDLESNIGKEIYYDGEHKIYVTWLQKTAYGGYDIGFRSSGQYTLNGASLISGVYHETANDHLFTSSTTAELTVEHDGEVYNASASGRCGLNYKDGDCFSFVFFLRNETNEVASEVVGRVRIVITELYKNNWSKKYN